MKKLIRFIVIFLSTVVLYPLKGQEKQGTTYLSFSAGQGFKRINLMNNTTGVSLPSSGLFYRFSFQSNLSEKNLFYAFDYNTYTTEKESQGYHLYYSDQYYTLSIGKNITKQIGVQLGLGGNYSKLRINKKQFDNYNDSIFNNFQYLSNEFSSPITLAISAKLKYKVLEAFDNRLQGHLIFETLYKTKLEREFEKDHFSKFAFNLGLGISYRIFN